MAIKIINLQSEDAPTNDDLIVIRDNLTGTTRKITRAVFFENPPIPTGAINGNMIATGTIQKRHFGEDAKIGVRTYSIGATATLTPNANDFDVFAITGQNRTLVVAKPTGTPVDGQGIMFRFRDNGTARSISWNSVYRSIGVTVPTATTANRMLYVSARWNAPHNRWDILSVGRE